DMIDTLKDRLQAIMGTSLKDLAKKQMNQTFSVKQRFINNSKVSDHHAIIPTEVRPDMNQLSQRESKIYMMTAQRYLENLMPPHEYEALSIDLSVGEYKFTFKDKLTTKLGFKAVYDKQEKMNEQITQMEKGETLKVTHVVIEQHETTPPAYFNEGTLLKA